MKIRLLWKVIKRINFDKVLYGFIGWFVIAAIIIQIVEPGINRFGDALWYTFVASTSIGFGDFAAVTFIGRLLTVLTTIYEIVIVAMFSGTVVSYYLEVVRRREKESLALFMDKMEHLTELSRDELQAIEDKIKAMK